MAFDEKIKLAVKKKADFRCCMCYELDVEIHHITPQSEGGSDKIENAAPLCSSHHNIYGDNPKKRKFIRQKRDAWYDKVSKSTFPNIDLSLILKDYVRKEEFNETIQALKEHKIKNNHSSIAQIISKLGLIKPQPSDLTRAKLCINNKEYKKAKDLLEKVLTKHSENYECHYLLGYLNGEEDNLSSMIDSFDKSLAISNKFEKNITDSKKYQWQDNFNKGIGFFNRGTKVTDKDSSKMYFNKSVERFQNCIIVEPDSVTSYQNMFYSMINAGRDESELEAPLLKIIDLNKSADAYVDLSKVYNNQAYVLMNSFKDSKNVEDKTKAMEIYDKEILILEEGQKLYPENSKILAQLSNAYVDANKLDVAMTTFQKGIEKDPTNEVYRYNYGVLLIGANDFENAIAQFQKAIDLKEDYTSAYYNLGVTYLKWGADLQEKVIEAGSKDISYKEKFKAAIAPLDKYLKNIPEDSTIWEYLGKVYANLGETEKSKTAFAMVEKLNS
jgi:tetratricopeptide (TPR) repeat protein